MDQLPIRIKLDFSGLDNPDYKYVWYPVMRRNFDRIWDLKHDICAKYNVDHESVDLFLAGAQLREDDTILLLRENDNIQVIYKQKPPKDIKKSRKRKHDKKIEGSCPLDTVAGVPNGVYELETSGTAECLRPEAIGDDLEIPKKRKKKRNKRRDSSPVANCMETCDVDNMVSKELESVANEIPFKDAELDSSKRETLTSEYHIKTNRISSSSAPKYEENSSVVVSPDRFQNSVNVESSNCPKKKRKRKRKRKSDVSGRKSENNTNKMVRSAFQVIPFLNVIEPKNKHIRFDTLALRNPNDGEHVSDSKDECNNSFPDHASELSDKLQGEDPSSRPNFSTSSPVKVDVVSHLKKNNNTQHAFTPSGKLSVAGIEKPVSCERYPQDFETCNSYNSSIKASASPQIISLPLVECETVEINEKDKNDLQVLEIPMLSTNGERPVLPGAPIVRMENQTVDYDSYPQLHTVPQVGALIAFKLLELSDLYCPEVSDYKEGVVVEFDKSADTITVELQKEEVKKRKTGKFENVYESDEENEPEPDIVKRITCKWMDLISPRLLVSSSLSAISNPLYMSFSQP